MCDPVQQTSSKAFCDFRSSESPALHGLWTLTCQAAASCSAAGNAPPFKFKFVLTGYLGTRVPGPRVHGYKPGVPVTYTHHPVTEVTLTLAQTQ
eukprot:3866497-Rhodomonas_salina.1